MSGNDTTLRIGKLMSDLADCIQELNRARSDANDLAPNLRVLADCFDSEIQDVSMVELHGETEFTFRRVPERRQARGQRAATSKIWRNPDGKKAPLVSIPDGARLAEIAHRIQDAKATAEDILCKLRIENIDVRGICKSLSHP